jgi:hypothetical protein
MFFGGRRPVRLFATAVAFLASVTTSVWSGAVEDRGNAVPKSNFHITPYLQDASPDAITIMWETKKPTASEVEYWERNSNKQDRLKAADDSKVKIHRMRIAGLRPETHYEYRVRCGEEVSQGDFTTAPARSRPIRFAIFGDSRFWSNYWETTRLPQHLLSRTPEFTLHMGDLVGNGLQYRQWPAHFRRFESVSSRVPMFAARGNHERDGSGDPENDWFAKYHELPGGEPYSSFDWGNSHFAIVSYTHISKCASFLDADLGATNKKWKFVAFHYPVYCTGYESPSDNRKVSGNPELEAIFDKHRVDMVFNGHTHIYERTFPLRGGKRDDRDGTVYLVQGGAVGGNYPDWWTATIARDLSFPHYSLLEVGDDNIELRSYGLAKGDQKKGEAARIVEIDHYIRWRNEDVPRKILSGLADKRGTELLNAMENLGAMCYGPAAHVLVRYLRHNDAAVRRAAALALERIANAAVTDRSVVFLRDEDVVVRRHIARALEAAMLPEVAERIVRDILDPKQDSQVRSHLLGALLHHARRRAFTTAMKALEAADGVVRDRAADVVKRTATQNDLPLLVNLVGTEKRPYVFGCLTWGINHLRGKKAK